MRSVKNMRGFSLLELLISVAIGSIILLSVVALFQEQGKTYKAQDALTVAGQRTRLAMDNIARELGLAGYGLPAITASLTAARSPGNTTIYVPNTGGFTNGDTVYLCGSGVCESAVISSSDPQANTEFEISTGLTNSFAAGDPIYTIKDDRTNLTLEAIVDSSYDSAGFNSSYFNSVW
ncbi:MAG: PilW family protein, partial [Nitrospinota bacterium]